MMISDGSINIFWNGYSWEYELQIYDSDQREDYHTDSGYSTWRLAMEAVEKYIDHMERNF